MYRIQSPRPLLYLTGGFCLGVAAGSVGIKLHLFGIGKENYHWNDNWDKYYFPDLHEQHSAQKNLFSKFKRTFAFDKDQLRTYLKTDIHAQRHLIFVRHGQSRATSPHLDPVWELTDLGKQQAALAGQYLSQGLKGKHVTAIYFSPMKRAKDTAEIIAKHFQETPLKEDGYLIEGIPEMPDPPIQNLHVTNLELRIGHTLMENAFSRYFYRPTIQSDTAQQETFEIFVCHGNVIRYLFCRALQFPTFGWLRFMIANASITWLTIDNHGAVRARQFGNMGFIDPSMQTYQ